MVKFKNESDKENMLLLHPVLLMIFYDLSWYAKWNHGIDLTITDTVSTLERDNKLNRKSPSHREHRAIDIRTKDIDAFIIQDLVQYINSKKEYKKYHYLSSSGVKRLAYYHIGTAEHLHLAIHSQYAIK